MFSSSSILISSVANGFSCLGLAVRFNGPAKLDWEERKVAVGDDDAPRVLDTVLDKALLEVGMSCADAIVCSRSLNCGRLVLEVLRRSR